MVIIIIEAAQAAAAFEKKAFEKDMICVACI
jgi:hypothetical protein